MKGERVRVFPDIALLNRVKEKFIKTIEWPQIGLPNDCYPLLAAGRDAFVKKNERIITHGGIALEEIIVPFVHVEKVGK